MNVAVGTFLLFLLVIPGISFRSAFNFGPLTKKYSKTSAFDDFVWAIIPGVFFQLLAGLIVNTTKPFGYSVNFQSLGKIFFNPTEASDEFGKINLHLDAVLEYNVILITLTALIGYAGRKAIRHWHLDHYSSVFRFNNEWFYVLRGETIFFKDSKKAHSEQIRKEGIRGSIRIKDVETCQVYAVVKSDAGQCYIYSGLIHSFYMKKDGDLDSIIIMGARRTRFFELVAPEQYEIQTDIVALKNSEIITISVQRVMKKPDIDQEELDPHKGKLQSQILGEKKENELKVEGQIKLTDILTKDARDAINFAEKKKLEIKIASEELANVADVEIKKATSILIGQKIIEYSELQRIAKEKTELADQVKTRLYEMPMSLHVAKGVELTSEELRTKMNDRIIHVDELISQLKKNNPGLK